MHRKIILLFVVLVTTSCTHWQIKKQLETFCKDAIHLPAELESVQEGAQLSDSHILRVPIKLIFYFSADRCTSCVIGRLGDYEKVFNLKVQDLFSPILIFSPKEDDREYKALITDLKLQSLPYPVYIDKHNNFPKMNPQLPEDSRYHVFLLDKNNKVVLVGNPLASDAMWNLFKSTLDNMLAHDGVYVPEN